MEVDELFIQEIKITKKQWLILGIALLIALLIAIIKLNKNIIINKIKGK